MFQLSFLRGQTARLCAFCIDPHIRRRKSGENCFYNSDLQGAARGKHGLVPKDPSPWLPLTPLPEYLCPTGRSPSPLCSPSQIHSTLHIVLICLSVCRSLPSALLEVNSCIQLSFQREPLHAPQWFVKTNKSALALPKEPGGQHSPEDKLCLSAKTYCVPSVYIIGKYLLSTYYVPGILLDTGYMAVYKTNKISTHKEFTYNGWQIISNQQNTDSNSCC